MTIVFSLQLIDYLWEITIFFTIKSLPDYLLYPVNEIPLEDIFLSCAKIFEKPVTSHEGGSTLNPMFHDPGIW